MTGMSPRTMARLAGLFAVLEGMTAVAGQSLAGRMVVSGNAAATAANVMANQTLFWAGFTSSLLAVVSHIAWVALLYLLFKPVSRTLSLVAAFVGLVACSIQAFAAFFQMAPMVILDGRGLSAFEPDQLQALALLFFRFNGRAFNLYEAFFGLWCFLIGCLIIRSTFMPRIIGVLEAIAGLAWATRLSPPLAEWLSSAVVMLVAPGELSLLLWLLIAGVNEERWNEQAGRRTGPSTSAARVL